MKNKTLDSYIELLRAGGLLEETNCGRDAHDLSIDYISYSSLDIKPQTLFICKGLNFKEQYLTDALEKGAVAYMAEKRSAAAPSDTPYIIVSDIRRAMSEVSGFFFDHIWNDKLTMVGITGTKGKSTTATFVKSILDHYCCRTEKTETGFLSGIYTYDGRDRVPAKKMTTPETLELHRHLARCVENDCEYFVMETSSQALKYSRTDDLHYRVAAFLNISEDHISDREHPDIEDYFSSKLKLFHQADIACVNLDIDEKYQERVLSEAKECCQDVITFGMTENADFYGSDISSTPNELRFKLRHPGGTEEITVSIGGNYNAGNALAAIAITRALGIPFDDIRAGLANVKVAGRMEVYHLKDKDVDVIVDYAHNKLSYQTLFSSIGSLYPERKVLLVFGAHGNKAYNRRKDLGELANIYADKIVLTEQDPGTESVADICEQIRVHIDDDKPVITIPDRGEAIEAACEMVEDGWVMVIAGNGADGYQKRGLKYVEEPTDGERVCAYIEAHR